MGDILPALSKIAKASVRTMNIRRADNFQGNDNYNILQVRTLSPRHADLKQNNGRPAHQVRPSFI